MHPPLFRQHKPVKGYLLPGEYRAVAPGPVRPGISSFQQVPTLLFNPRGVDPCIDPGVRLAGLHYFGLLPNKPDPGKM